MGATEETIAIRVGDSHYDAIVGPGLLPTVGPRLRGLVRGPRCAVIADENSARLFAEPILESLRAAHFEPLLLCVAAGEQAKSLEQLGALGGQMATARLDRSSFVVALGGGVIGDLAGFTAAVYHRGLPCVQVPTTLLAQVDSSIGGKSAVNLPAGKNLLGAIQQPVLVLADVDTLKTLPSRELRQGFAEIVKHAIIADPSLFDALTEVSPRLIARNIEIKAAIVARDERETTGARAALNFGHTVGHAIEQAGDYRALLHGEAVSLGMVAALEISVQRAGLAEVERARALAALREVGLPTCLPNDFPRAAILPALFADKKFERGAVRFVITPALGSARLTSEVTMDDLARAVAQL